MAYNEELALRIREVMYDICPKEFTEKKMFGGLAFFLQGHLCCGVMADKMIVRIGPDGYEETLTQKYVSPFDITGKSMRGWITVALSGLASKAALSRWATQSTDFVRTLPPKIATKPKSPNNKRTFSAEAKESPKR